MRPVEEYRGVPEIVKKRIRHNRQLRLWRFANSQEKGKGELDDEKDQTFYSVSVHDLYGRSRISVSSSGGESVPHTE